MGTLTGEPIGVGGIKVGQPIETTGAVAPVAEPQPAGLKIGSPITTTPYRPPVNNFGPLRTNIENTKIDPTYFDDLNRVMRVGIVDETIQAGTDELSGSPKPEDLKPQSGLSLLNQSAFGTLEAAQGDLLQDSEALGAVETAAKFMINFFGEGLSSAGALIGAVNPIYLTVDDLKDKSFSERYLSGQMAIAAAHGRAYDYAPLMETTDRNLEAIGSFMESTVGAAGHFLGENTLETTGSPALAVAAQLVPDALLLALPFLPKAARAFRESRAISQFERELNANFKSAIEENGLFVETVDEFVGSKPTEVLADSGIAGQTTRVRNAQGEILGDVRAIDRGGNLQLQSTVLDDSLRGKGIGIEMYENQIARAQARGYASISSDTQVSPAAANVYEGLSRRGYRIEKNTTAVLEDGQWVSGNGAPIYRIVIDEAAATSTLEPMRMNLSTIQALRGGAPPLDPAMAAEMAAELRAGKLAGDIIVETVEGTPVRILSGVENLDAAVAAAEKAGLNLRTLNVKLQERAPADIDVVDMNARARAGMDDLLENQRKMEASEQAGNRSIVEKLVHLFADTSGNVKAQILKSMGEMGQAAIRQYSLIAGAVPKAHMMFQDFHRAVYGARAPSDKGLSFVRGINHLGSQVSEVDLFNILVQSRRTQAIVRSGGARAKEGGGFELVGAVRPENASGNIWAIRNTLGENRFAQLQARADVVFDTMHQQLVRLRENGIITQRQFVRMQNIDYIRREFIEAIDPVMLAPGLKSPRISIGESGIYHLKGGTSRAQNIDVQSLVAEYLARTEGRIFRNNANRALREAALANPENGLVTIPKTDGARVPPGMAEIKVMIDGKSQRMFMKDLYAAEWVVNDPGINATIANIFRIINGTMVVKPLATGMNPAFAVVNFPRDIMHAWKATGNEYSAFLPRYLGQIFHDIWKVRKDVWNKEGRYREYIEDGGGMNFLTHGGFDPFTGFSRSKDLMRTMGVYRGGLGQWWGEAKEILSKVNEFSELSVRLAVRERVLQNQLRRGEMPNRQQATFVARDYLDFSQGGSFTKAIESWLPYSNAAAQAIRTSARAYTQGARGASVAALKDMQVVTMKAIQSGWAWMEHPEVMAQVDPHTAYTSQVYPTGLHFNDNQGNRRNVYVSIAMDTTTVPFTALFDRAISKHALLATGIDPNDIPSDHFLKEIASVVPILSQIQTGTPTFQAAAALLKNKDIWANRDIWTGDPYVLPGARRNENTAGTMFDTLGQAFPEVVSPVQLQKAWRTYVPSNFYIDSADFIRKQVQQSQDPVAMAEMMQKETGDLTLEIISQVPGLNRLVHLTHPAAQTTSELRMLAQETATYRELERQAIDKAVHKFTVLGDGTDLEKVLQSIAQVRPMDAARSQDLLITQIAVEQMYKNNEYDIGFVGEDWFNLLAGQNAETRANLYYWKHVQLSDENADNLNAVVNQIDQVAGRRIWTDEFQQHLAQLVSQWGTREERLRAVMGAN